MNKSGGYTWLQTCATVVCNSKNAEEQNIICVNYVIRYEFRKKEDFNFLKMIFLIANIVFFFLVEENMKI